MNNTILYLNDVAIDLYGQSGIVINYSNGDIDKLLSGTTKGSFSYEITIPATKTNKKLFYFPELILDESFDDTTEKNARLEVGGNVILDGFARITTITKDKNIIEYSIILFEGNSGWISQLKDKSIRDIDYTPFDHIYSKEYQLNSEIGTPFVAYPYMNIGKNTVGNDRWKVEDRFPAFNVRKVFVDILRDAGYSVNSDFFNKPPFTNLYFTTDKIPQRRKDELQPHKFRVSTETWISSPLYNGYKRTYLAQGQDYVYNELNTGGKIIPFDYFEPFTSGYYDFSNSIQIQNEAEGDRYVSGDKFYNGISSSVATYNNYKGFYYNNFKGKMSFEFSCTLVSLGVSSKANPIDVIFSVLNAQTGNIIGSSQISMPKTKAAENVKSYVSFVTDSIEVSFNERYIVLARVVNPSDLDNTQSVYLENVIFSNKIYETLTEGATVYIEDNLPDIKQSEFIQDIRTAFNLYFTTNELTKTVFIEPSDEFYTGTALDWTNKYDASKPKVITHLGESLGSEIQFTYAKDSEDKYIKTIEEKYSKKEVWLSKTVKNNNKSAQNNRTIKQINNFATTYIGSGIQTMPTAKIPLIWSSTLFEIPEVRTSKWTSRLLYYNGRNYVGNNEILNYEGVDYPYYPQYTTNYADAYNLKHSNSLDWNTQYYSFGLFDKHYKNTIETINNSRKVQMYIKLSSLDILNLNFRTPIYISDGEDGNYYHLEQVHDYTPESIDSRLCTFIKVINPSPLVDILTTDSGILTPPYINDELDAPILPSEPPTINTNMVVTFPVWMSTIENPTGEFVNMEYNVVSNKLTNSNNITNIEQLITL